MSARTWAAAWLPGPVGFLLFIVVVSAGIGAMIISSRTVAAILADVMSVPAGASLGGAAVLPVVGSVPTPTLESISPSEFAVPRPARIIVSSVRLPRIPLAVLIGFALAVVGTVTQGFFYNSMVDPSIVDVSFGAVVGTVAAIVLPLSTPLGLEGAAFVSVVVTVFVVYLLASEDDRTPVATLLPAGVATQTLLDAIISFLFLQSGESLRQVVFQPMGHLVGATWSEVRMLSLVLPLPSLLLVVYTRDLSVLLFGEEDAYALGIEVEQTKQLPPATASVVTAAVVSASGIIGFAGLVVPHMLRLLVGSDHRVLLPASVLVGASFLVITDTVARSGGVETLVGVVTAAVGAFFFLYLLRAREVRSP